MTEVNDEVVTNQTETESATEVSDTVENSKPVVEPTKKKGSFKAKVKEWFRKKIVNLKRKPQKISFIFYIISTAFFLIALFTFSKGSSAVASAAKGNGILIFVSTLLSILVLVSFLNAFPKRKKPIIAMLVLVYVMSIVIIVCDVSVFVMVANAISTKKKPYSEGAVYTMQPLLIVHVVLVAISTILLALTPVLDKLIKRINTQVVVEDNNLASGEEIVINE